MPSNYEHPDRDIAGIQRLNAMSNKPTMVKATVISVPPQGPNVWVRIGGSSSLEEAIVPHGMVIRPLENVVLVRPVGEKRWIVSLAYQERNQGSPANMPQLEQELKRPDNFTVISARQAMIAKWTAPPQRSDILFQLEMADAGDDLNALSYYLSGTEYTHKATPGTIKIFRARSLDEHWARSGWTAWATATSMGMDTGTATPTGTPLDGYDFYDTDTHELYVAEGGTWHLVAGAAGVDNFLDLTDTPNSYAGMGDKFLAVTANATGVEFVDAPAGGSVLYSRWDVLAPPASPSAYDDEFEDESIDAMWDTYDPNTVLTASEIAEGLLKLISTATNTAKTAALYQALPSGAFTITVLAHYGVIRAEGSSPGIVLFEDAADQTKQLIKFSVDYGLWDNKYTWFEVQKYTDYDSAGTNLLDLGTTWAFGSYFLRLRFDTTDYYFEVSQDGLSWVYLWGGSIGFTPAHMGIGIWAGNNNDNEVKYSFFRYQASNVGFYVPVAGQKVGFVAP